jgi:hypothetical protein
MPSDYEAILRVREQKRAASEAAQDAILGYLRGIRGVGSYMKGSELKKNEGDIVTARGLFRTWFGTVNLDDLLHALGQTYNLKTKATVQSNTWILYYTTIEAEGQRSHVEHLFDALAKVGKAIGPYSVRTHDDPKKKARDEEMENLRISVGKLQAEVKQAAKWKREADHWKKGYDRVYKESKDYIEKVQQIKSMVTSSTMGKDSIVEAIAHMFGCEPPTHGSAFVEILPKTKQKPALKPGDACPSVNCHGEMVNKTQDEPNNVTCDSCGYTYVFVIQECHACGGCGELGETNEICPRCGGDGEEPVKEASGA